MRTQKFPWEVSLGIASEKEGKMHRFMAKWLDALHSDEPEAVAALYADDATFLPTMSGDHKMGTNGALEYFQGFLRSNPRGTVHDLVVKELGEGFILLSGFYNFSTHNGQWVVEARFTFVAKRTAEDQWTIIHHHSSAKPKPMPMA